jgi:hypothetical protein
MRKNGKLDSPYIHLRHTLYVAEQIKWVWDLNGWVRRVNRRDRKLSEHAKFVSFLRVPFPCSRYRLHILFETPPYILVM